MNCEKCGEKNLEGSSKCKKCGNPLINNKLESTEKKAEKSDSIVDNARIKLCDCGTLIQDDWDICPNCGRKLEKVSHKKRLKEQDEDIGSDGNILLIISITCYLFPLLLTGFVVNYEYIFIIFRVTCLILITMARVKYPENKNVKLFLWLFMLAIVTNIIIMIFTHSLKWTF